MLEAQLGNDDAMAGHLRKLKESRDAEPEMPQHLLAMAYAGAFAGWLRRSDDMLEDAADAAAALLAQKRSIPMLTFCGQTALALSAIHRRDRPAAEIAIATLTDYPSGLGPFALLAAEHVLGLLAQTMGDGAAAAGHFDAARQFCRNADYRPAYGWATADYAAFLLERNDGGDHARAITLQNEALEIGRELDMRPLVERVLARREMLTA